MNKADLRTKAGRRREILEQVRASGGFSIFWVTDNTLRAAVATEMLHSGELIVDQKKSRYPFHVVRVCKKNDKGEAQPPTKKP